MPNRLLVTLRGPDDARTPGETAAPGGPRQNDAPVASRRRIAPRPSTWLLLGAIVLMLLWARVSLAQVPPHYPGTVCFTPEFWCWAQPPGPPGSPCICPSPMGYVGGVRG